ncbi:hypothetical protein [Exiguobacterium qingdaonense]|uniref:hypothetical protein n=1 Tax=Exiguobacterium qingdaonense TaxID=2751251 RepID=UPI001BE7398E|nr:hypothetical protein [Exiguobacterium qingdaonense]
MKFRKSITILTLAIGVLALIASVYGVFSSAGQKGIEFTSLHDEVVKLHGGGLYKNESVSMVAQAVAQDVVTLCFGVPLLMVALILTRKGLLKGKLLFAGILGYFLYTYVSYTFYAMYNSLFLVYVAIMSCSFFAFTLTMISFDLKKMHTQFSSKLPVKFIGSVLIFIALLVALMWLEMLTHRVPDGLDHYTTLVIQALDLGFVVPIAILSGVLLMKRNAYGYLLSSVIIVKEAALLIAIIAMLIGQKNSGVNVGVIESILFPLFLAIVIFCLYLMMKNIKEGKKI